MAKRIEEKRRYLRLNTPIEIEYSLLGSDKINKAVTKDVSAIGLRFPADERFQNGGSIEIKLKLPNTQNPVHASGRVAWTKKEENGSSYDIGVEFLNIEEDNKNTFLEYLCDLIYG